MFQGRRESFTKILLSCRLFHSNTSISPYHSNWSRRPFRLNLPRWYSSLTLFNSTFHHIKSRRWHRFHIFCLSGFVILWKTIFRALSGWSESRSSTRMNYEWISDNFFFLHIYNNFFSHIHNILDLAHFSPLSRCDTDSIHFTIYYWSKKQLNFTHEMENLYDMKNA